MAVWHRFVAANNISSWIIVYGSEKIQDTLTKPRAETISNLNGRDAVTASAAFNSLLIMIDALQNWDEYVGYLSSEFKNVGKSKPCH